MSSELDNTCCTIRRNSEEEDETLIQQDVEEFSTVSWGNLQPSDFYFGKTLGEGAFARVVLAKRKNFDQLELAIKIMEKLHIKKENKIQSVLMEKRILTLLNQDPHPFLVSFRTSFQDANYLYMCFDLVHGGELTSMIQHYVAINEEHGIRDRACDLQTTKFYTAEIVEALQHLHNFNPPIIHRDLKPENILIQASGHIKVTDFGTATIMQDNIDESMRNSFVGTPDYVSPEVLHGEGASRASDLWAVGCITYQLLSGTSPFRAETEYLMFTAVTSFLDGTSSLPFPGPNLSSTSSARDFIMQLLIQDPSSRLGASPTSGYDDLKKHPFFENITWEMLPTLEAPYVPDPTTFPKSVNMLDGATDDWLFEGEATEISDHPHRHQRNISAESGSNHPQPIEIGMESLNSSATPHNHWLKHFKDGEVQVFAGLIYKRKGLFTKKRQLILTDHPRLIYFDPESMEYKGEIPWDKNNPVTCIKKSSKEFDVKCSLSGRVYHLSDGGEAGSQPWIDFINAMLEKQRDPNYNLYRSISGNSSPRLSVRKSTDIIIDQSNSRHHSNYRNSATESSNQAASPSLLGNVPNLVQNTIPQGNH